MTVSKSLLTVSTLAFAMMFGGGVYILMHLNTLAKPIVERIASDSMGVPVDIDSLEISLKEKRVAVRGIHISNPPGFKNPYAVIIGKADVALARAGDALVDFKDIIVHDTEVFVEVHPDGTNLSTIQKGITAGAPESENPLKVIIRRFILNGATISPSVTLVSEQELAPVEFYPVELAGIGEKQNGILAREAVAQVMRPLMSAFSEQAGDAGFYQGLSTDVLKDIGVSEIDQFKTQIKKDLGKLGDGVKQLFD